METRVIYSAAVTSLDSWDMENLKYLRKISRTNPLTETTETESYNSHSHRTTLVSDEEFLHAAAEADGADYEESQNKQDNSMSSVTSAHTDYSGKTIVSVSKTEKNGNNGNVSLLAPLDSCYLLDIVTVRNESVLANRINSAIPGSKPNLGSDGYESSSAGSSIDEGKTLSG
jgi:hypothetical protein